MSGFDPEYETIMRDFKNLKSGGKLLLNICNNNGDSSSGDYLEEWFLNLLPYQALAAQLVAQTWFGRFKNH